MVEKKFNAEIERHHSIEKKIHYPTEHELCKLSKETHRPNKRFMCKMAVDRKTMQGLPDKIKITKKANDVDLYISEELERIRQREERGVKSRNKRKEEEI